MLTVDAVTKAQHLVAQDLVEGGGIVTPVFTPDGQHVMVAAYCQADSCSDWTGHGWNAAWILVNLNGAVTPGGVAHYEDVSDGDGGFLYPGEAVSPDGHYVLGLQSYNSEPLCFLSAYKISDGSEIKGWSVSQKVPPSGPCTIGNPDWQPLH